MFRKILVFLGLISVDSEHKALDFSDKLQWLKIKVILRGFFIGLLLYPWIWVWGGWTFLFGLIVYLINSNNIIYVSYVASLPYSNPVLSKGLNAEWYFIVFLGGALFANYTIAYFSHRKNSAVGILMFIISMWILLIAYLYVFLIWQYNLTFLK